MSMKWKYLWVAALTAVLVGCGGGSGGDAEPEPEPPASGPPPSSQSWGEEAAKIASLPGVTTYPSASTAAVSADADGNVTAVWHSYDGSKTKFFASRFSVETGTWSTAERIHTADGTIVGNIVLLQDPGFDGHVHVGWVQLESLNSVSLQRFNAITQAWEEPLDINVAPEGFIKSVATPAFTIDASGSITVLAVDSTADGERLYSTFYDARTSVWSIPGPVTERRAVSMSNLALGTDDGYNATASWVEEAEDASGEVRTLWAARRAGTAAGGWTAALNVAGPLYVEGFTDSYVTMAVSASGETLLAWLFPQDGARPGLKAVWLDSAGQAVTAIATLSTNAFFIDSVIDPQGRATVSWEGSNGLRVAHSDAASQAWGATVIVTTASDGPYPREAQLLTDEEGNLTLLFLLDSHAVVMHRPVESSEWETPVEIDSPANGDHVFTGQMAWTVDRDGVITTIMQSETSATGNGQYILSANRSR